LFLPVGEDADCPFGQRIPLHGSFAGASALVVDFVVVVGLVGLVGAAVVDFTAVLVGAAAGGLGRGVTGGGTSSDGLAVRGLEAGVAAVVSSIGPSAEAGRGTSVTAAAGGTAVISSGTSGARRVDAHAVVAATTTTATTPNPAQGRSLRTRLGRRTIGTIVVRSSTGSARGTNRVRVVGPVGVGGSMDAGEHTRSSTGPPPALHTATLTGPKA